MLLNYQLYNIINTTNNIDNTLKFRYIKLDVQIEINIMQANQNNDLKNPSEYLHAFQNQIYTFKLATQEINIVHEIPDIYNMTLLKHIKYKHIHIQENIQAKNY